MMVAAAVTVLVIVVMAMAIQVLRLATTTDKVFTQTNKQTKTGVGGSTKLRRWPVAVARTVLKTPATTRTRTKKHAGET